MDGIRRRYGADSIKRACFLPESDREWIDHMGGGGEPRKAYRGLFQREGIIIKELM